MTITPGPVRLIAKLTGPGSINDTEARFQLKSTDLGIVWDNGSGQLLCALGDSFGAGWTGPGGGLGDEDTIDWRSNLLARSTDRDLAAGMRFDSMAEDRPGHAREILASKKVDLDEKTVIPTGAVSVGDRQYLTYMSVRHWGEPGEWQTGHAGIAFSDDNGETWTKSATAQWPNSPRYDDPFQLCALVRRDGYVFMFGTPNGRFGNAHLARVAEDRVLDKAAYEYWTGEDWQAGPDSVASPVFSGPVGELSVQFNDFTGTWLALHLDESRNAIVLRAAAAPTGPWSNGKTVVDAAEYPSPYGGFMHPWSTGPELYFTLSQWDPYNVFLMCTTLR
ncbi:MAG TPA: DUF4185 domain-containing protein [Mycobacteriales bacterium]|jgi:hypothetical protein|nr:DUF4185 domain-containing protein [Mycobacteriales bacterium]